MAEIIFVVLIFVISRAFFVMLRCPNCKTLRSIVSLKKKKELDEDGKEQMNCKVCNYSWKRFHLLTGGGDGGGSDGGFG
jgi:primosomal protein N'